MSETIILDPSAEAAGRTEFDITPWVSSDGIDWGDAVIEQYMSQQTFGQTPVDHRVPNRQIQIPLRIVARGTVSFARAREMFQSKAALFQQEGGVIGRTVASGTVYADVTNASLRLSGSWLAGNKDADVEASLTLEALPDWYGPQSTLATHSESTLPELVFTETALDGNYPGRTVLEVTDTQGADQLGLLWGIRSRTYSAASTARLAYEAEALQTLDAATTTSLSGASGGTVVQHTGIGADWTPVVGTNIGGTSYMTHEGSYKVWARLRSSADTACAARFVYDVGDLTLPAENDPWYFPAANQFFVADLGQIRLDRAPSGTHRWQGAVQAKRTSAGGTIQVDRIWFQPLDEYSGKSTAPLPVGIGGAAYVARDDFNQTSGTLTGKSLQVGGTWAFAGDTTDLSIDTTNHVAERTAVSDTGPHFALAGTAVYASIVVQGDAYADAPVAGASQGFFVRYAGTATFMHGAFEQGSDPSGNFARLGIYKTVGGTVTRLGFTPDFPFDPYSPTRQTCRVAAYSSGHWSAWSFPQVGVENLPTVGQPHARGYDTDLATGGTLASGRIGIYDYQAVASAETRRYDNFAAWVPGTDAAVFANQSAQIRTDGAYRQDTGGTAYGPISRPTGDLPRLPPAGLEGRTTEVFVKLSRGDLDQLPDTSIDNLEAALTVRPCWLFLPDA